MLSGMFLLCTHELLQGPLDTLPSSLELPASPHSLPSQELSAGIQVLPHPVLVSACLSDAPACAPSADGGQTALAAPQEGPLHLHLSCLTRVCLSPPGALTPTALLWAGGEGQRGHSSGTAALG